MRSPCSSASSTRSRAAAMPPSAIGSGRGARTLPRNSPARAGVSSPRDARICASSAGIPACCSAAAASGAAWPMSQTGYFMPVPPADCPASPDVISFIITNAAADDNGNFQRPSREKRRRFAHCAARLLPCYPVLRQMQRKIPAPGTKTTPDAGIAHPVDRKPEHNRRNRRLCQTRYGQTGREKFRPSLCKCLCIMCKTRADPTHPRRPPGIFQLYFLPGNHACRCS